MSSALAPKELPCGGPADRHASVERAITLSKRPETKWVEGGPPTHRPTEGTRTVRAVQDKKPK